MEMTILCTIRSYFTCKYSAAGPMSDCILNENIIILLLLLSSVDYLRCPMALHAMHLL